jgi:hypothetical protein
LNDLLNNHADDVALNADILAVMVQDGQRHIISVGIEKIAVDNLRTVEGEQQ